MTDKYEISDATFRSVFEKVPNESRINCLRELRGMIDSYISMIEDHGDIQFSDEGVKSIIWCDDNVDNSPIDFTDTDGVLIKTYGGSHT